MARAFLVVVVFAGACAVGGMGKSVAEGFLPKPSYVSWWEQRMPAFLRDGTLVLEAPSASRASHSSW